VSGVDAEIAPVIFGAGHAESSWDASAWLQALPRHEATHWLADIGRLVVVSPHPDDETLGCGGLIAEARRLGVDVLVLSVTDGEACYADDPEWPPERTRLVRRAELRAALTTLGVADDALVALDVGDGGVAAREDALASTLESLIAPGDVVLTTWRFDGHPDHEATARATARAVKAVGARVMEYPVWAWHWIDPERGDARLQGAFACRLSDAAQVAKREALAAFASQRARNGGAPILPPRVMARFERDFEVLLP